MVTGVYDFFLHFSFLFLYMVRKNCKTIHLAPLGPVPFQKFVIFLNSDGGKLYMKIVGCVWHGCGCFSCGCASETDYLVKLNQFRISFGKTTSPACVNDEMSKIPFLCFFSLLFFFSFFLFLFLLSLYYLHRTPTPPLSIRTHRPSHRLTHPLASRQSTPADHGGGPRGSSLAGHGGGRVELPKSEPRRRSWRRAARSIPAGHGGGRTEHPGRPWRRPRGAPGLVPRRRPFRRC
jgi:hypothetical protein